VAPLVDRRRSPQSRFRSDAGVLAVLLETGSLEGGFWVAGVQPPHPGNARIVRLARLVRRCHRQPQLGGHPALIGRNSFRSDRLGGRHPHSRRSMLVDSRSA